MGHDWRVDETLEDRLIRLGWNETDAGCWEWKRSRHKTGYGQLTYRRKLWKAHRAAYAVWVGDIPADMHVCHTCDNPPCINPDHLFLGTNAENHQDKWRKGRHVYPVLPGEMSPSAKLSADDVRDIRKALEAGEISGAGLGRLYGVSKVAISKIKKGETWKSIG